MLSLFKMLSGTRPEAASQVAAEAAGASELAAAEAAGAATLSQLAHFPLQRIRPCLARSVRSACSSSPGWCLADAVVFGKRWFEVSARDLVLHLQRRHAGASAFFLSSASSSSPILMAVALAPAPLVVGGEQAFWMLRRDSTDSSGSSATMASVTSMRSGVAKSPRFQQLVGAKQQHAAYLCGTDEPVSARPSAIKRVKRRQQRHMAAVCETASDTIATWASSVSVPHSSNSIDSLNKSPASYCTKCTRPPSTPIAGAASSVAILTLRRVSPLGHQLHSELFASRERTGTNHELPGYTSEPDRAAYVGPAMRVPAPHVHHHLCAALERLR